MLHVVQPRFPFVIMQILKKRDLISYVQQFTPRFLFHLMNGWNEFMTYIRHGDPCRHMEASLEGRGLEWDHDSGLHFLNEWDWKQGGGYLAGFPKHTGVKTHYQGVCSDHKQTLLEGRGALEKRAVTRAPTRMLAKLKEFTSRGAWWEIRKVLVVKNSAFSKGSLN